MTTSYCRHSPLSPERETCCILPVNQLSRAYFLTKWKKCNIVSLFLQIHIVESTIHHSLMRTVHPFFQERSCILHFPFWRNFSILSFYKKHSASHRPEFRRNLPTADKVCDLYPFSPERKKVLYSARLCNFGILIFIHDIKKPDFPFL